MKITDIRATTVTVPLEAPLRHSNGAHWGRFVRTILEVETDEGITGLGEMGGGGESAELAFSGLKSYLVGHDPFELNRMRYAICNPTVPSVFHGRVQTVLRHEALALIGPFQTHSNNAPVAVLVGQHILSEQSSVCSKEGSEAEMNQAGIEAPSIVGKSRRTISGQTKSGKRESRKAIL